jgi:hypothetical protein
MGVNMTVSTSDAAKAVVRRNTEEVQGEGNFELFEELFADDFVDHTPQPGGTPDKAGARDLYRRLRAAFPDFHAEIHWQRADGDVVTTYKTYHGTHHGEFLGIAIENVAPSCCISKHREGGADMLQHARPTSRGETAQARECRLGHRPLLQLPLPSRGR